MNQVLEGLAGGGWPLLFGWVFPSALATVSFSALIFPKVDHLPVLRAIADQDEGTRLLAAVFVSFALGLVLSANRTPLYRLAEGYSWPSGLRDWGVKRELDRRVTLGNKLEATTEEGWDRAKLFERLRCFPASAIQTAPSPLGNTMRAFEIYGRMKFGLDSQLLWVELYTLAPDSLRTHYDRSRAGVDFFVCSMYLGLLVGLVALASLVATPSPSLLIVGIASLGVAPVAYRLAVVSAAYMGSAVQAVVNISRKQLASTMGLELPETFELERKMWRLVNRLVFYPVDPDIPPQAGFPDQRKELGELNRFRTND